MRTLPTRPLMKHEHPEHRRRDEQVGGEATRRPVREQRCHKTRKTDPFAREVLHEEDVGDDRTDERQKQLQRLHLNLLNPPGVLGRSEFDARRLDTPPR